MEADRKIRAYYKLAEQVDGEAHERIRNAIARRRRELAAEAGPSMFDDVPPAPPQPERWTPPDPADFRPDAR